MHSTPTNPSRRSVLRQLGALPAAGIAAALPRFAHAAEFSLKYGNNLPVTHPLNVRAQEAAERIAKETKGRVEIKIFPNNQLGGDTDMLAQVRSGGIDFFTPSALVIATLVPVAAINATGFAFADYNQVWSAMDGKVGAHVRAAIGKMKLHAFEKMWDNGFRQMTSSKGPIAAAKDMDGLKIRVPVSPLSISMFKALGASPTSLQFSEVYSALQTKIVDAQENPLPIIQVAKLFEVQKNCSLSNHIWDGFWFIANGRTWESLPADLKTIVSAPSTKPASSSARTSRSSTRRCSPTSRPRASPSTRPTPTASAPSCAKPASTPSGRAASATRPGACWSSRSASSPDREAHLPCRTPSRMTPRPRPRCHAPPELVGPAAGQRPGRHRRSRRRQPGAGGDLRAARGRRLTLRLPQAAGVVGRTRLGAVPLAVDARRGRRAAARRAHAHDRPGQPRAAAHARRCSKRWRSPSRSPSLRW